MTKRTAVFVFLLQTFLASCGYGGSDNESSDSLSDAVDEGNAPANLQSSGLLFRKSNCTLDDRFVPHCFKVYSVVDTPGGEFRPISELEASLVEIAGAEEIALCVDNGVSNKWLVELFNFLYAENITSEVSLTNPCQW